MHTNDAATTFPRLIEMNVEPFLIASSLNIVVALRLVRKICPHCKASYKLNDKESEMVKQNAMVMDAIESFTGSQDLSGLRLYRGNGCKACHNTGFIGRVGIFEILDVSEDIRLLITKKASADVIGAAAEKAGMVTLLRDGVSKALNGTTTIDEAIKVAGA
jgi:type II secretory ATPase GspE/PulE/Tfp pilus assembly ATPase PilB-like protein